MVWSLLLGMIAVVAPPPVGAVAEQPVPSYVNPVVGGLARAPSVLRAPDGTYYAYLSGFDFGGSPWPVPVFESSDLASWSPVGPVLSPASAGAWADASSGLNFTSPSVHEVPGNPAGSRYVLYFTAKQAGGSTRCIGVATAGQPAGPFTGAASPLVCPPDGAQDPSILSLPGIVGFHELLHVRNGAVYNQLLTADGLAVHPGWDPIELLAAEPGWWHEGLVERPTLASPGDPTRGYLLFAGGTPDTGGRAIGWARCQISLLVVTGCTSPIGDGRLVTITDGVAGPGGPQVFSDGAHQWLAYDGRPGGSCGGATCTGPSSMRIDKLCVAHDQPRTNAPSTGTRALTRDPDCSVDVPGSWVATWASPTTKADPSWAPGFANPGGFEDETLRQIVHTSIGGSAVRVQVSNRFGTGPLEIGSATVAVSTDDDGSTPAVAGPVVPLTFGGQGAVTLPAGEVVVSDAVTLTVPDDHDLAVNLYFPTGTGVPYGHRYSGETSYIGPGNLVDDTGGTGYDATTEGSYYLTAVDVLDDAPDGAVVVLGDSLSDGFVTVGLDSERRWPDRMVDRLLAAGPLRIGVPNVAYAGASLLPDPLSEPHSGLGRLDRDVLAKTGVRTVFVHLGTNDIGAGGKTASEVVAGLQELIVRAHAVGVRVVATTIPPTTGAQLEPPACQPDPVDPVDPVEEAARQAINERIRPGQPDSLAFDAVVDFDAVLRNPAEPARIHCRYSFFGNFHPNEDGHLAEADAVDLSTLIP